MVQSLITFRGSIAFKGSVPLASFPEPYGVNGPDKENRIFRTYPYLQNSWKRLKFFKFWVPQCEIRPDGLSVVPQPHFTPLWTINAHTKIAITDRLIQSSFDKPVHHHLLRFRTRLLGGFWCSSRSEFPNTRGASGRALWLRPRKMRQLIIVISATCVWCNGVIT